MKTILELQLCRAWSGTIPAAILAGLLMPILHVRAATPLQIAQQACIKASNTGANDWFGYAVAVAGDTVVVGAHQESSAAVGVNGNQGDNSAYQSGAAYVFVRANGGWRQQAYLKASNAGAGDLFGFAVAVSGDTVVVGAPQEFSNASGVNGNQNDNSATNSGAVYIYVRHGTNWIQQAYLKASNTELDAEFTIPGDARMRFAQRAEAGDKFGSSVAVAGDTVVVGAPGEDSSATGVNGNQNNNTATNSGAAYVFMRTGTNWAQQAYAKASNTGGAGGMTAATSPLRTIPPRAVRTDAAGGAFPSMSPGNLPGVPFGVNPVLPPAGATSQAVPSQPVAVPMTREEALARLIANQKAPSTAPVLPAVPPTAPPPPAFPAPVAAAPTTVQPRPGASVGPTLSFAGAGYNPAMGGGTPARPSVSGDAFGSSVAISGDTIVVGAPSEGSNATGVNGNQGDNSAPGSGAAYVFIRSGTNWIQQAYVKASNTGAADRFGQAVAIADDTVVIGATDEDSSATGVKGDQTDNKAPNSGAAYVFVRNATNWTQQAYLKASSQEGDMKLPPEARGVPGWVSALGGRTRSGQNDFGVSVAVSGDIVVVGAHGEASIATGMNGDPNDNSARSAGAAYVFVRNGTNWTQHAFLKAHNTDAGDEFGGAVAVSGTLVVVGANAEASSAIGVNGPSCDNSARGSGAAYVFDLNAGPPPAATAPETAVEQPLGTDLRDGAATVDFGGALVGSSSQQRTFTIKNTGTTPLTISGVTSTGANSNDFKVTAQPAASVSGPCGTPFTVHFSPSALGARIAALHITSHDSDESPFDIMLTGTGDTPMHIAQQAYLKASNTGSNDCFGSSVAVSGDTVVVGAPSESSNATGVNGNQSDNSATNSGAVYVFVRSGSTWIQQAYLKASNAEADDRFGSTVAMSGDTLVVGTGSFLAGEDSSATGVNGNQSDNSATNSGAVHVFVRHGTTWTQQAYLKASNAEALDSFGSAVAVSRDTIVVGAWQEDSAATGVDGSQGDNSATHSGAAYVFVRRGTTWMQQAYLKPSNTRIGAGFGWSVEVSGDTVVVGARGDSSSATGVNGQQEDNNAPGSGAAYVFVRHGANWFQQAYLKASNSREGGFFGHSVAVSGDTVIVGTHRESSGATGVNGSQNDSSAYWAGAAYVFARSGTNWSQQAYLKASNIRARAFFGWSVAVSPDTVVVGSPFESSHGAGVNSHQTNDSARGSGAAYVFRRHGTNWVQQAHLKASNAQAGDDFGRRVALSGDTLAVGALPEASRAIGVNGDQCDNSARYAGATYVFDLNADLQATLVGPPEIAVEQPPGAILVSGAASVDFGGVPASAMPVNLPPMPGVVPQRTFTIKNTGQGALTNLATTITGAHSNDFRVTAPPPANIYGPCGSATFTVSFMPTAAGPRTATLHLTSNDPDESPFAITLTGMGTIPPALAPGVVPAGNRSSQSIYTPYAFTNFAGMPGERGSADGAGSAAGFNWPVSLAVDRAGNVYVADSLNSTIRKITPAGGVTTLAGSPGQAGNTDGAGSTARFNQPDGVAADAAGNVYVADQRNHTIRKITPEGVVTTLAGSAGQSGSADGTGSAARFYWPVGVAADREGNVYVADSGNHTVRKITPGGVVTTLAGSARERGSADGAGSSARFGGDELGGCNHDVAVDPMGNVYVADRDSHTIRKITPAGVVTTLAGWTEQRRTTESRGSTDGIGAAARFLRPVGVAVDSAGHVYVADGHNLSIRRITPAGAVTTLAGSAGQRGAADGIGSAARFGYPAGVAVDRFGNIYVADRDNHRISKGTPVLVPPPPAAVPPTRALPRPLPRNQPVPVAPAPSRPAPVPPPPAQPRSPQAGAASIQPQTPERQP